jgi:hypothetical protein
VRPLFATPLARAGSISSRGKCDHCLEVREAAMPPPMSRNEQYTVVVTRSGGPLSAWEWEICRNGQPLPARVWKRGFKSEHTAKLSGNVALRDFLSGLAQEESKSPEQSDMKSEDFRRIALSMPDTAEVFRRGRSEFRVERKAFASLEGPGDAVATVNLTTDQQSMFAHESPEAFVPVAGGWGRLGRTSVNFRHVTHAQLQSALRAAWQNVAPKSLVKGVDEARGS